METALKIGSFLGRHYLVIIPAIKRCNQTELDACIADALRLLRRLRRHLPETIRVELDALAPDIDTCPASKE